MAVSASAILALDRTQGRRIVQVVSLVVFHVCVSGFASICFHVVVHISLLCLPCSIDQKIRVVSTFLSRWSAGAPDRFRTSSLLLPGRCLYRSIIHMISLVACLSLCPGALRVLVVAHLPAYSSVLALARV